MELLDFLHEAALEGLISLGRIKKKNKTKIIARMGKILILNKKQHIYYKIALQRPRCVSEESSEWQSLAAKFMMVQ